MKQKKENKNTTQEPVDYGDEFDFGGLPKDISLTKNIGCASSSPKRKSNKKKNDQ